MSSYGMGNTPLSHTQEEKDLGMYVIRVPLRAKVVPVAGEGLRLLIPSHILEQPRGVSFRSYLCEGLLLPTLEILHFSTL